LRSVTHGWSSQTYEVLLRDGPRDGTQVTVPSLPDGEPPDVLPVSRGPQGAYVLAGNPNPRGITPYRWVTREEWAGLKRWLRLG
jgi:hypothetical protein